MIWAVFTLLARGTLLWIFGSAALGKLWRPEPMERVMIASFRLRTRAATLATRVLIALEFTTALGLLLPIRWPLFTAAAAGLLFGFSVVIARWPITDKKATVAAADFCRWPELPDPTCFFSQSSLQSRLRRLSSGLRMRALAHPREPQFSSNLCFYMPLW